MTRAEVLTLMSVLKAAFPSWARGMSRDEAMGVVNLWCAMFSGDDAQVVTQAVAQYIATQKEGYPPTIGAIKDRVLRMAEPVEMTEVEAWARISQAIANGIYGAQREFDSLPKHLQRLVGSPSRLRDWAVMDSGAVQSVVASNLMRSYKAQRAEHRDRRAIDGGTPQLMTDG